MFSLTASVMCLLAKQEYGYSQKGVSGHREMLLLCIKGGIFENCPKLQRTQLIPTENWNKSYSKKRNFSHCFSALTISLVLYEWACKHLLHVRIVTGTKSNQILKPGHPNYTFYPLHICLVPSICPKYHGTIPRSSVARGAQLSSRVTKILKVSSLIMSFPVYFWCLSLLSPFCTCQMCKVNNWCPTELQVFETLIIDTVYPEFVCQVHTLKSDTS